MFQTNKPKPQCRNRLVIDLKKPDIFFCIRDKGHKGLHKSWHWTPAKKKTQKVYNVYWDVLGGAAN